MVVSAGGIGISIGISIGERRWMELDGIGGFSVG
jgi:hypothetical protein